MQLFSIGIKDTGTSETSDITLKIVCFKNLLGVKIIHLRVDQKTNTLSLKLFDRTDCAFGYLMVTVKQCSVKIRNDQLNHLAVLLYFNI